MKKVFFLSISIFLFAISCTDSKDAFTLEGTIVDAKYNNSYAYLNILNEDQSDFIVLDSAKITDNKFIFKGKVTEPASVRIVSLGKTATSISSVFILESGHIEMTFNEVPSIKGTPMNDAFQAMMTNIENISSQLGGISNEYQTAKENGKLTQAFEDSLFTKVQAVKIEIGKEHFNYLKNIIDKPAAETLFIAWHTSFDAAQLAELFGLLPAKAKENKLIQTILAQTKNVSSDTNGAGAYIDVKGNTPEGKTIAISDYVGKNKVVLIDFWASWCGPCIKEMPNVKKAYDKYHSKGFEIVGISLDENKTEWTNAIHQLGLTWPQMSDLKGWDSQLSAPYGIEQIPATYLLDSNGIIIGKDLRGEQLEAKLAEILK
ncbi:MAG: redoxin domain-containing protein [Dysgonomonas sp.]